MADQDRDVTITISAKNLTEAEFKKVRKGLEGITDEGKKTSKNTSALSRAFQSLGKAAPGALKIVTAGAGVAAGAVAGMTAAVAALAGRGTELAGVSTSFQSLAAAAGESSNQILSATAAASRGLVTDLEIMQAANKGLLLGLPITAGSMAQLSQTAIVLGKAMKQDAATSLDDLITGLGRASPLILDNLGITVKAGEANATYAAQLGKSVKELTDAEKKTAFYNAAMTAARAKVAELGEGQLTLAERFQQTKVFLTNLLDGISIGIAQSPVFNAALSSINDMLQNAFGGDKEALVLAIVQGIEKAAFFAIGFARAGISAAQVITKGFGGIKFLIFGIMAAFSDLETRIAGTVATVLESASNIPVLGEAYAFAAEKARAVANASEGVTANLRQQAIDASAAALGQDWLGQALERSKQAVDQISQSAANAGLSQRNMNAATQEAAVVTAQASTAAAQWNVDLTALPLVMTDLRGEIIKTKEEINLFGETSTIQWNNAAEAVDVFKSAQGVAGGVVTAQTAAMTAAYHFFGLKTRAELQKTAEEAEKSFELIKASGIATEEELQAMNEKVQEAKRAAQGETEKFTLSSNDSILSGTSTALQNLGTKFKAAAIAQAIIATLQSIAKTWAQYGWPLGIPFAAAAAVAGYANVAKIRSSKAYQEGTPRLDFESFGRESFARLHGFEAVIPQGSGHLLGREVAAELARMRGADGSEQMVGEIRGMIGELRDLPQAIQRSVRDGMMLAST